MRKIVIYLIVKHGTYIKSPSISNSILYIEINLKIILRVHGQINEINVQKYVVSMTTTRIKLHSNIRIKSMSMYRKWWVGLGLENSNALYLWFRRESITVWMLDCSLNWLKVLSIYYSLACTPMYRAFSQFNHLRAHFFHHLFYFFSHPSSRNYIQHCIR